MAAQGQSKSFTVGNSLNYENMNVQFLESKRNEMKPAILACLAAFAMAVAAPVQAGCNSCCEAAPAPACCPAPAPCCPAPAPVCCPPPPVKVCWTVKDPCTGCCYQVEACVPACCEGVVPCLDGHRKGLFGRKILTYKFACCDHCVDVVITRRGRTIVRD